LPSTDDILFYHQVRCANDELPVRDAEFYPLVADDFSGLPATATFSADINPLRDDSCLYVEKLRDSGVDATWYDGPGLPHDYLRARHTSRKAAETFGRICEAIKKLAGK
jgi:acetyl esterase